MYVESQPNQLIDYSRYLVFSSCFLHHDYHRTVLLLRIRTDYSTSSTFRYGARFSTRTLLPRFTLDGYPFQSPGLINNALKETSHRFRFEWTAIHACNVFNHLYFSIWRVDRKAQLPFDPAELDCTFGPLVEQPNELLIDLVYFVSPVFNSQVLVSTIKRLGLVYVQQIKKRKSLVATRHVHCGQPVD